MNIIDKVQIHHSPAYDFVGSMFRLMNDRKLSLEEEDYPVPKVKPNEQIKEWVEASNEKLPDNIREKLDKFFNWETFFGNCLIPLIADNDLKDAAQFIKHVAELPEEVILRHFLQTGYGPLRGEVDESLVADLLSGKQDKVKFIDEVLSIPREQKWTLLQFFTDPQQMKQDLLELFYWYYENIYRYEIERVESVTSAAEQDLAKNLRTYGNEYLKLLLRTDYSETKRIKKIIISISYYYEFCTFNSHGDTRDVHMLGYRYPEAFVAREHAVLANVNLFKALADETRLNIIRLLAKRERYGRELAGELELSNSTVSYHLSLLIMNELVTFERKDNRSYYSLSKEKVRQIISDSLDELFA